MKGFWEIFGGFFSKKDLLPWKFGYFGGICSSFWEVQIEMGGFAYKFGVLDGFWMVTEPKHFTHVSELFAGT